MGIIRQHSKPRTPRRFPKGAPWNPKKSDRVLYDEILAEERQSEMADILKHKTEFEGVYWNEPEKFYLALHQSSFNYLITAICWSTYPREAAVLYDRYMYRLLGKQPNFDKGLLTHEIMMKDFGVKEPKFYNRQLEYRNKIDNVHGVYLVPEGLYRAAISKNRVVSYIGTFKSLAEAVIKREEWLDEHPDCHSMRNSIYGILEVKYGYKKRTFRLPERVED